MKEVKKNIPGVITAGNLVCGFLAITCISRGDLFTASWLVILAGLLDFFDGFAARLLNVHSDFGKQLDSLADVVTFGVVPGFMVFTLLSQSSFCRSGTCWKAIILPYYALLIPVFSAIRLAKFNVDPRQSSSFIGVPTPANGLMIACLTLTPPTSVFHSLFRNHVFLISVALIMSYLLVAKIPLFALKFKSFDFQENWIKYLLVLVAFSLVLLMGFAAAPFILILYILLSLVDNRFVQKDE